jgi:GTP cyclohydrolase II
MTSGPSTSEAPRRLGLDPPARAQARVRTHVDVPLSLHGGPAVTGRVMTFDGLVDRREHLLVGLGDWQGALRTARAGGGPPLVRLHSECLTGDVLGSQRCDCGPQLGEAVERIAHVGGFLLYLRQEGRGIGLYSKIDAYALQDHGLDTYEANRALGHGEDDRDYQPAAQMLLAVAVDRIRLLTNNLAKAAQLELHGVRVEEVVPTAIHLSPANERYLRAKRDRGGQLLSLEPPDVRRRSGTVRNGCAEGART